AAIVVGPFAAAGYSAARSCAAVTTEENWTTIAAPGFAGGAAISTFAIDPQAPNTIFATNGTEVMRTSNGGCSWAKAFSIELLPTLDRPISSANSTIKQIVVPEAPQTAAARTVYLLVEEKVGPASRPHLVVSTDGAKSWTLREQGLPALTGGVLTLAIAPSDPHVAYMQVRETPADAGDVIYASKDSGANWEQRSQPGDAAALHMTVDPTDPEELWFWGGPVYHSLDGARRREVIDAVASTVSMIDVFHAPGHPSRVIAYESETQTFNLSYDGGNTWKRIFGPGIFAHSIAHGNSSGNVIVSGHLGVYRFAPPESWLGINPKDQPDLYELQAARTPDQSLFGRSTDNTIERYDALDEVVEIDPFVSVADDVVSDATRLQPAHTKIKLAPGESKTIDYRLGLPPHPRPLDVFFLMDTSKSMDNTIDGLRAGMQSIITSLEAARINVQFGVGEYKDYPIPGYGSPEAGDFPYRLDRRIGPADAALADAMEELAASGGGQDIPESQLTGLYQAATGEGEAGFVPPGQDAGFRAGALKVIVHMTDAPFHNEATHPSPPFEVVAGQLLTKGIRHIGLAVYGQNGPDGLEHLTQMSEATNTLAPPSGVDCDGDHHLDVLGGQPLACVISLEKVSNLSSAIIATLEAVTEDVEIALDVQQSPLVKAIDPLVYPSFNVHQAASLDWKVTFTCPRHLAGTDDTVALAGTVDGRTTGSIARATIVCRSIPEKKDAPDKVLPLLTVPALLVPQRVPAPPPAPPGVAESAPSTQQMFQAQPAAATREQEEVQTAVAWQEAIQQQAAEEYSFTSYRRPSPAGPPWLLYGSAVLMGLAYAGLSLRSRPAPALRRSSR
ncbi:MAG: hypothetical protein QOK47_822, partial [Actinomycetota bacterium]|nr:hypothetical protein [Actinomycetota bacterium]